MLPQTAPQPAPLAVGPNGQAVRPDPDADLWPSSHGRWAAYDQSAREKNAAIGARNEAAFQAQQAAPPDRYQALLAGVQQMLQPVVQWLREHGVQVTQLTEAIPALLAQVDAREQLHHQIASMPLEWQTRIEQLERGLQQLALAIATLRQSETPSLVPQAPEQPYSSFLIEDREQAQLEQALLQQQRTRPQPWE